MALVTCPECRQQVSTDAVSCPHCGKIDTRSLDDTEFHQTLLERLFGIGEVWIVSTDKVAPKEVLHRIRDPRKTRELIRTTAYHASQRQLYTRST